MVANHIEDIIQDLSVSSAVASFNVLKLEVGRRIWLCSVKCKLSNEDILEIAEYVIVHKGKLSIETYSFHWQTT